MRSTRLVLPENGGLENDRYDRLDFRSPSNFAPSADGHRIYANNAIRAKIGDVELLEAAVACDEILPTGRRPRRAVAAELYLWILGGKRRYPVRPSY